MQALAKLLKANSDPSDTLHKVLGDELAAELTKELLDWQNVQHSLACMQETYRRRRARKEAHP